MSNVLGSQPKGRWFESHLKFFKFFFKAYPKFGRLIKLGVCLFIDRRVSGYAGFAGSFTEIIFPG